MRGSPRHVTHCALILRGDELVFEPCAEPRRIPLLDLEVLKPFDRYGITAERVSTVVAELLAKDGK